MVRNLPRLLIGGVSSGCGKTTVSNAVLQALCDRKISTAAFKCGPDYIDPMFYQEITGKPGRNLDLFFCDADTIRGLLAKHTEQTAIALIEGVMGYYDGVAGTTDMASSADLCRSTQTPSVLVVPVKGRSLSLAAEIKGYLDFAGNTIAGIILNEVSAGMYPFYKEMIEKHTGLRVYGHLPSDEAAAIASRHLGLLTAHEISGLHHKLHRLAQMAEQYIDIDGLLALATTADPLEYRPASCQPLTQDPVCIAVARDAAFCFYYQDNLEMLQEMGAKLVFFSPLTDAHLPEQVHGLYLGGGYPELYAKTLSENDPLRAEIRHKIAVGLPTLAECGGFIYLHEQLENAEGASYPMVGVITAKAKLQQKMGNFGYLTLTANQDTMLCRAGEQIRAHEFHYVQSDDAGDACNAQKPLRKQSWNCVHATKTLFCGYPHMHFYANPTFAQQFVQRCDQHRKEKTE